jgi:hypothetical protein
VLPSLDRREFRNPVTQSWSELVVKEP